MSAFAICKRRFADRPVTAALYVYWGATLLQYLKFCLDYPHTCSMTFRYIPSTLLIGCLFLGYAAGQQHLRISRKESARKSQGQGRPSNAASAG